MRHFLFLIALLFIPPALAQTVEQDGANDSYSLATERAQNTFLAYQGALEAARRCDHLSFSADELLTFDRKIAAEMAAVAPNVALGAARLQNLRRDAQDDIRSRIWHQGCAGPDPTAALDRFNQLNVTSQPEGTP
jgi:hypothetical protein